MAEPLNFHRRMKVLLLSSCAMLCLLCASKASLAQCGVERWSVKTGTDADANLVSLAASTSTTIANLSSLTAPSTLPENGRVAPAETTVWFVTGTLREYVRAYDSDYHMVIVDDAGR